MTSKLAFLSAAAIAMVAISPVLAQGAEQLGTHPISRAEVVAAVKAQFAAMDTNHDGSVSPAEFDAYRANQAGREGGLFQHVGGHWFEKADANGDGRVTLEEAEARPLQMFDTADSNHDGVVSVEEKKVAMMMMRFGGK